MRSPPRTPLPGRSARFSLWTSPLCSTSPLGQFSVASTSSRVAPEPCTGSLSLCSAAYGPELSLLPIYLDIVMELPRLRCLGNAISLPYRQWCVGTCGFCVCTFVCAHILFLSCLPLLFGEPKAIQWGIDKSLYKWPLLSPTGKTRDMICFYHQLAAGKGEEMESNSNNFKSNISTLGYSSYFLLLNKHKT